MQREYAVMMMMIVLMFVTAGTVCTAETAAAESLLKKVLAMRLLLLGRWRWRWRRRRFFPVLPDHHGGFPI